MTGSDMPASTVRHSGEGQQRWFYGGGVHTWLALAEETGGAFLLFEDAMDNGKRTPLHTHPEADETMYVLQGEIVMHLDGTEHRLGAGSVAVAPRGPPRVSGHSGRHQTAVPADSRLLPSLLLWCERAAHRRYRQNRGLQPRCAVRRNERRDRDPRAAALRRAAGLRRRTPLRRGEGTSRQG